MKPKVIVSAVIKKSYPHVADEGPFLKKALNTVGSTKYVLHSHVYHGIALVTAMHVRPHIICLSHMCMDFVGQI